jgi:hypothetical protein
MAYGGGDPIITLFYIYLTTRARGTRGKTGPMRGLRRDLTPLLPYNALKEGLTGDYGPIIITPI